MKIAVLGGTHGNEPVGIKAMEAIAKLDKSLFSNEFDTFLANPKAYEIGKRYVDSDLNRAFGKMGTSKGYEKQRSQELKDQIEGKYDFIVDLHTTTSNMGLTVILTHLDKSSVNVACYLKSVIPELKIIISPRAGQDCPYTSHLGKAGITVEVGSVANNVIRSELVIATFDMVKEILSYKFDQEFDYSNIECFHTQGLMSFPEEGEWMLHHNVDGHDFKVLKKGDPLFINIEKEVLRYEGEEIYPLFVNEAAYLENATALEYAVKRKLSDVL